MFGMTDSATEMPTQPVPDEFGFGELIEMPPPEGWVVHLVEGKPQQTQGSTHWAWCKVTLEGPGYTEVVFTEADGQTIANPYPKPTPDSPDRPLRLGPVLFKVFC